MHKMTGCKISRCWNGQQ